MIFDVAAQGVIAADPPLDLTPEVITAAPGRARGIERRRGRGRLRWRRPFVVHVRWIVLGPGPAGLPFRGGRRAFFSFRTPGDPPGRPMKWSP